MKLELDNKVVLVGGASRGIGLAIAQAFIDHDCQVILTGRNPEDLASACQALGSSAWAYAADQIRINGVAPGNIGFPGGVWDRKSKDSPEAFAAMLAREVPQNRLGAPQDVADAVVFLASARAAFITGTILVVDGGQTRSW